jgi:cytochrome c553
MMKTDRMFVSRRAIAGAAAGACLLIGTVTGLAQAPARGAAPAAPPAARGATAARKPDANLAQLMRGLIYPSSNVVFAAQSDLNFPAVKDPATSPNLLTSTYGGWQAVESAALGLAESANLLTIPGRICSNGVPAPVTRPDWIKFTQGLRDAGLAAYKAAQSKNQDAMVDASGTLADACSACHDVYREKKGGLPDRCKP